MVAQFITYEGRFVHVCGSAQVMEEGEKLSKKVQDMEGSIRKLRGQISSLEADRDKLGQVRDQAHQCQPMPKLQVKASNQSYVAVRNPRVMCEA